MITHSLPQSMTVSFYFKYSQTKSLKDAGFGTIYYYLMLNNRKSKEKSTKIECNVSEWNSPTQKLLGLDLDRKNKQIKQIKDTIEKNKDIFEVLGQSITADELIEMTTVNQKYKKTFFEVLQEYKAEQFLKIRKPNQLKSKSNIEQSTYDTYLKREKKILEYFQHINKLKILCMDVDSRFLELFDNWLTQHGCGQLYATKCIKLVKTVMVYAKNSKIIKINFADSYKNKTVPKKKVKTLKKADYDKLLEVQPVLTETERKYVDVMIFMRETLLHVGDYRQLTSDNIKVYENGSVWLIKPRMKRQEENNQIQIIPLSDIAIEIIRKYNGIENMPKTVDTCINKYIKMACHKAGIEMSVSTKLGRSSGISHKYNVLKMRERSIAVAAGWTSTAHLVDYLEVDMEALRNEFLGEKA